MYSIYADSKCIYSDMSPSHKNKVVNPELTMEDNSAGSLKFTIPAGNEGYEDIERLTSTITVKRNNVEIWSGRVLDEDTDFYNNRTLYCEGELAYFNDSKQPPAEYHDLTPRQFLERIIAIHNAQVSEDKEFTVGAVTVVDPNDSIYRYTNYESTLEVINDKLVNRLGGHIVIRKQDGLRYIDYLKDYIKTSTQQINFGKNLLDFAKNYTSADFVTVILPRGAAINGNEYNSDNTYKLGEYCYYDGYVWRCISAINTGEEWNASHWTRVQKYFKALSPYLTVEEVNNGSIFVADYEAVQRYGWIVGVHDWPDVTEPDNLLSKAEELLETINFDNLELDVSAVDLKLIDVDYDSFDLLDRVRVISKPHGLDQLFPIRKIVIPLDAPESTTFTLTSKEDTTKSLTGVTNKNLDELQKYYNEIMNEYTSSMAPSKILESAKANASNLINMATNGYVTIVKNQNGTSELLITDERDYTVATKIWRWNMNGLGYSRDGGRTYGLAMTMDGSIVADFITTGIMTANRIRGGSLLVGGSGVASDGEITIKDSSNRTMINITKYGMTLYDENGVGKAYLDHSGLRITGGLISASQIVGSSISMNDPTTGNSILVIDTSGMRMYNTSGSQIVTLSPTTLTFDSDNLVLHSNKFSLNQDGIYTPAVVTADVRVVARNLECRDCAVHGELYVEGSKHRIVNTGKDWVAFEAYETATPYFGDIGEGSLDENGECYIFLDESFIDCTEDIYQVFLQAYGEGTCYPERHSGYFIVKGTPNLKFGFEVKAVQKDRQGIRYKKIDDDVLDSLKEITV